MITAANFTAYDEANPRIWESFVAVVAEYRAQGFKRWDADTVLYNVRRQARVDVDNNYSAYYASKWAELNPEARDFFKPIARAADEVPTYQPEPES